jgi:internalin A
MQRDGGRLLLAKRVCRLRIIATAVALSCFIAVVLAPAVALAVNPAVNFPDSGLDAVVRGAIGMPTGQIYASNLTTLTSLDAQSHGIANLDGLEYATNLEYLDLFDNNITSITPLGGLTQLTSLKLRANNITSITAVGGLTNLESLELGAGMYADTNNNLTDITPLSGLTNLTNLWLDRNNITDITPLSGLSNLTDLSLGANDITDITPLSGLSNLTGLYLEYNHISDISPVSALTNLTNLELDHNSISDIAPVSGLANLTDLVLNSNNVTTVTPVSGLTNLSNLDLGNNNIVDITPVSGLANLGYLALGFNHISDITPVSGLANLNNALELQSNNITTITAVSGLVNLKRIELGSNHVASIAAVSGLANLEDLCIGFNNISDISPIAGMTTLTRIEINDNDLTTITVLSGLPNLDELHVSRNWLDLSPGSPAMNTLDTIRGWVAALDYLPQNTLVHAGSDVTVTVPVGMTEPGATQSASASATFSDVTTPGGLSIAQGMDGLPGMTPSGQVHVGNSYYDVQFTGSFNGTLTITMPYDPRIPPSQAAVMKVGHWNGSSWDDVTVSVDTTGHTVTFALTSLSPVALFGPSTADTSTAVAVKFATIGTSRTVGYNAATKIFGRVLDASSTPIADQSTKPVSLERSADGVHWTSSGSVATLASGWWMFSVNTVANTYFRVRFAGDPYNGASASQTLLVRTQVSLAKPALKKYRVKRGVKVSVWSYLKPRFAKGSKSVAIYGYHLEGKRWVKRLSASATNSNYSTYTKATVSVKFSRKGKWRVYAYHSDANHAATTSGYASVTVK